MLTILISLSSLEINSKVGENFQINTLLGFSDIKKYFFYHYFIKFFTAVVVASLLSSWRFLRSILADLSNVLFWIVLILPQIFSSLILFFRLGGGDCSECHHLHYNPCRHMGFWQKYSRNKFFYFDICAPSPPNVWKISS